jgi:hypothetical protein
LAEFERAVALRPRDYALWLDLGRARNQAGDDAGALSAFKEATRLAPFYAQPRWQMGNTLYRAGRLDEAFAEMRRAVESDPGLLPQALDMAWAASDGDPQAVEQALQPQTPSLRLALAHFFVKHAKAREAAEQFRAAGRATDEERRALLSELLAAKDFPEAFDVWSVGRASQNRGDAAEGAAVLNGGFEEPVILNDPGFGWQLPPRAPSVEASQDTAAPRSGAQSLRLVWSGDPDAQSPVLSQLVLVEPNARYRLRFAARTDKLITGGLPVVLATDASSNDARTLGGELTLPPGTNGWQEYETEFTTGAATRAVLINVRRQSCNSSPCPVFGQVWLDDFSMRRM